MLSWDLPSSSLEKGGNIMQSNNALSIVAGGIALSLVVLAFRTPVDKVEGVFKYMLDKLPATQIAEKQ